MLEMLKPFCATGNDPRAYMRVPVRVGDDAVGVNGFIAVGLLGAGHLLPEIEDSQLVERLAASLERLKARWQEVPKSAWRPISDIERPVNPEKKTCKVCSGWRFVISRKCSDCDGGGYFWHGSHEYECKECNGGGVLDCPADEVEVDALACAACDGMGWRYKDRLLVCKVPGMPAGNGVQELFVEKLAAIDGVEWSFSADEEDAHSCGVVMLRFPGGWGVLMSCRT